jgi:hypothetical protein
MANPSGADKTEAKGPSTLVKVLLSVVVFAISGGVATLVMGPSWMVERRVAAGEFNDGDRARMRANPARYLNMVGEGMREAVMAGSWDVLDRQVEFVLSTLDTLPVENQRMEASGLAWQLGSILGSISELERQLGVLHAIGAGSELRVRVQCETADDLVTAERVGAILPPLVERLRVSRAQDASLERIIASRCAPVIIRGITLWANGAGTDGDRSALAAVLGGAAESGVGVDAVARSESLTDVGALALAAALGEAAHSEVLGARVRQVLANPASWEGATAESPVQAALDLHLAPLPAVAQLAYLEELAQGLGASAAAVEAPTSAARASLVPVVAAALASAIATCSAPPLADPTQQDPAAQDPAAFVVDRPERLEIRLQPGQGVVSGDSGTFGMCVQREAGALSVPGQDALTRPVTVVIPLSE